MYSKHKYVQKDGNNGTVIVLAVNTKKPNSDQESLRNRCFGMLYN